MVVTFIAKNISQNPVVIQGITIASNSKYSVPFKNLFDWTFDVDLISNVQNGVITMSDGANDFIGDVAVNFILSLRPKFVITASEKDDIDLKLASDEKSFDANGICKLSLKIPGLVGELGARKISGGYGFTDVFGWGDRVIDVDVFDKDYVYAGVWYAATPLLAGVPGATETTTWADIYPDGVELGTYVDHDLSAWNHGWRLWCDDGGQGGVDIDPLGGLAKLPGQAYLVVTLQKTPTSLATRACLNAQWGKPSL